MKQTLDDFPEEQVYVCGYCRATVRDRSRWHVEGQVCRHPDCIDQHIKMLQTVAAVQNWALLP
ncbi:MAG: hypothetical protein V1778_01530 [bacterium]